MPYIPGLLSFRELPAAIAAIEALERPPECLMVDGHGIAHPRRLGVAAHLRLCGVTCRPSEWPRSVCAAATASRAMRVVTGSR